MGLNFFSLAGGPLRARVFCSRIMRQRDNHTILKPKDAQLFPFGVADRGLSLFVAFLVLITIFVPMIRLSRSGRIGLDLIFAFMLFSGAVATIRQRTLMYLVVALTIFEFAADLIVEFNSSLGHLCLTTVLKLPALATLAFFSFLPT